MKKPQTGAYLTVGASVLFGALAMAAYVKEGGATPALGQQPRLALANYLSPQNFNELKGLDDSFKALAKFVGPAVVEIRSSYGKSNDPNSDGQPAMVSEGSGFIFRSDGYILTNEHVVGDANQVKVTMQSGRTLEGTVTHSNDPGSDLAVVKVNAGGLPTLSFANSRQLEPGQFAMAVGAPFGLENSVTIGHVSALHREDTIENRVYPDLIQTDAAINMGNSGGPLVNVDGQVIGINTAIYSPTGMSAGIGFAIPSNYARLIANTLINKGKIVRSMIGLIPEDLTPYQQQQMSMPSGGALVEQVASGPAKKAGLQKGDVIVRVGDVPIHGQMDLRDSMLTYAPGTTVRVVFLRNGKRMNADVKLVKWTEPSMPQAPQSPQPTPGNPFGNGHTFKFSFPNIQGMPNIQDMPGFLNGQSPNTVHVDRSGAPHLGAGVSDVTSQARVDFHIPANVQGAVVETVEPNSDAAMLGLQPGDVITSFNGKTVTSGNQLANTVKAEHWGDSTSISFSRYHANGIETQSRDFNF